MVGGRFRISRNWRWLVKYLVDRIVGEGVLKGMRKFHVDWCEGRCCIRASKWRLNSPWFDRFCVDGCDGRWVGESGERL